jgi:hypothetical protein
MNRVVSLGFVAWELVTQGLVSQIWGRFGWFQSCGFRIGGVRSGRGFSGRGLGYNHAVEYSFHANLPCIFHLNVLLRFFCVDACSCLHITSKCCCFFLFPTNASFIFSNYAGLLFSSNAGFLFPSNAGFLFPSNVGFLFPSNAGFLFPSSAGFLFSDCYLRTRVSCLRFLVCPELLLLPSFLLFLLCHARPRPLFFLTICTELLLLPSFLLFLLCHARPYPLFFLTSIIELRAKSISAANIQFEPCYRDSF